MRLYEVRYQKENFEPFLLRTNNLKLWNKMLCNRLSQVDINDFIFPITLLILWNKYII